MVHKIYDEKMSVDNVRFLLPLKQKLILLRLVFVLCLTALSTRIINGKSFLVNIGKRKDLKTENKKQNKLVLGIQGPVVHNKT